MAKHKLPDYESWQDGYAPSLVRDATVYTFATRCAYLIAIRLEASRWPEEPRSMEQGQWKKASV